MKILHTSDWHLGQNFMGKSREDEHRAFLNWLRDKIIDESIDVLIVAGDIFDTGTPPNYALELYYDFLKNLIQTDCKYTIITAGNHDSVSTLKAPQQLLSMLNIYIIASGEEDEIVEIYKKDTLEGVVCAVPFLRDRVVRKASKSETSKDKETSLTDGIKEHYNSLYNRAKEIVKDRDIPIIATGHLTTLGAKSSDSERDIYIGGTIDIDSSFFSQNFNYVALGHLHNNQKVGGNSIRYSGSPIPLGFSEANMIKKVNIVSFKDNLVFVKELVIPKSRHLITIKGDLELIRKELESIEDKRSWISIELDDKNPQYAHKEIRDIANNLGLTILIIKIDKSTMALHSNRDKIISLDELKPITVFERLLNLENIYDDGDRVELINSFKVVLDEMEIK